jgi:tetratricopeptide (TPR) repeat protein/serine/threonine protein kinase
MSDFSSNSYSQNSAVESAESLVGQIADEFTERLNRGEQPAVEEYAQRYPQIADLLRQALPALQAIGSSAEDVALSAAPADQEQQLTGCLGDFRLLREIGRGGMGVVYEAEQITLGRRVALKVLPFAAAMDPKQLQRFKNEAQAAAHLHHTNIVPVFYVGCERGVHFYAMQHIDGQSLDLIIRNLRRQQRLQSSASKQEHAGPPTAAHSRALPASAPPSAETAQPVQAALSTEQSITSREFFQSVARLGIQAAEGLDYAHQQGILHRDIKPANLLLDVHGNLWITDFGLARFQSDTRLSMTGDLVGTLRYMSPEQALAKRVVVDHRTDIYSLGVTLYEQLALEPPFHGSDREELLRQIAFEEPRSPRRLNKPIPAELETIVLKAMEKNPAERYATAQELADDLGRFLEDKPIRARRPTLAQRAAKWRRRHPAVVWSAALITLILASSLGWIFRDRQARRTEAESRVVEALQVAEPKLRQGNPWDPELITAVRKAEAQLGDVVGGGLQHQVEQLLADLTILEKIEEIRLGQAAVKDSHFDAVEDVHFDLAAGDPDYAQAFQEYGIDVERVEVQEAATRIRQRAIATQLAAALDNWARAREKAGGTNWRQLLTVAREVDPDFWRCAFREAWATGKKEDLEKILTSVPVRALPPSTLALIGEFAQEGGKVAKLAVAVLREAQQLYPADFWINERLAYLLTLELEPPQLEEAIGFYRAALALRPESPGVYLNLGEAFRLQGRYDEAIALYRKVIQLKNDWAFGYNGLGNGLSEKGALDEAIAAYKEAIRLRQDHPWAFHNLSNTLAKKGALDEAVVASKNAIRLNPNFAQAYHSLGIALCGKGALDEAIAAYKEAIRLKPRDAKVHHNLRVAFFRQGRWDEAEAEDREIIRLKPNDAKAYNSLGALLGEHKRNYEGAIAAFREAIRLKPDWADAHLNLGNAFHRQGKRAEAEAESREAIRLKPDSDLLAGAYYQLGNLLSEVGRRSEAAEAYRRALPLRQKLAEKSPGRADYQGELGATLNNLAMVLQDQTEARRLLEQALAHQQAAIKRDPHNPRYRQNLRGHLLCLSDTLVALGAHADAARVADEMPRDFPEDCDAYLLAAKLLARCVQLAEQDSHLTVAARQSATDTYRQRQQALLDQAVQHSADKANAHNNVAWFLAISPDAKIQNPDQAVRLAQKAVTLAPQNGNFWGTLGTAYYRTRQWQDAVAALEKAMHLKSGADSFNWFFLAMAHQQLGDPAKARHWYDQAVEWMDQNKPQDEELRLFRAEAAALLGIQEKLPKKEPAISKPAAAEKALSP